jgi:hypothetical protein
LAGDLASFKNISIDIANTAISAILPVKQVENGIGMTEAI